MNIDSQLIEKLLNDYEQELDVARTPHAATSGYSVSLSLPAFPGHQQLAVVEIRKRLRALVSATLEQSAMETGASDFSEVTPDDDCDECGHALDRHGPDGCHIERGDGYRGAEFVEALGPCPCKQVGTDQPDQETK
jgi:hypothetical protein